jgi:DNA replication protein DnaC
VETSATWRATHFRWNEPTPKHKTAGESAERFLRLSLKDDRRNGSWLILAGRTGCGKTHLARAVQRLFNSSLIEHASKGFFPNRTDLPWAPFWRWPDVCGFDDGQFEGWFSDWVQPAILVVLDDIGAETDRYRSGVPNERLQRVLDVCERKWLLLTTNAETAKWQERFGARNADRMMAARRVTMFEVESWRMKGAKA